MAHSRHTPFAERSAADRLREMASRLRRDVDPYRSDPERILATKESAAEELYALARELDGGR